MKISERIPHDGKGIPVSPLTLVRVGWSDGMTGSYATAEHWRHGVIGDYWSRESVGDEVITCYKIVAEG